MLLLDHQIQSNDQKSSISQEGSSSIDESWDGSDGTISDILSEKILTVDQVQFGSCPILFLEKQSCLLEDNVTKATSIHDFNLLRILSRGAYGRVILAKKKITRDLFAIKVMEKAKMVDLNVADFIMNERNILNKVDNDFIVRGMYTF